MDTNYSQRKGWQAGLHHLLRINSVWKISNAVWMEWLYWCFEYV